MNSYTWILLLLAGLAATKAQELDLSDAFGDDDDEIPTEKPKEKPPPPKNADPGFDLSDAFESDPKKPAVVPPKSVDDKKKPASGGELDLSDAFGPDTETKKPMVPPKERETGGRSFDDNDLIDVSERGGYKPDGGGSRGRGGAPSSDDQSGGAEQPQDLDQQWLQFVKMLVDNIPEGLSVWIDKFNQVAKPLLEQIRGLLNVTEDKAEL
ncbi:CD99 molecule isoform 2 precursor [Danio rerio]|uniref:CD99 molecule isoform 2 precursor n=1 Tax=Danio rerio TaxID=7955 RepID=A0AB13ABS7_DANRE